MEKEIKYFKRVSISLTDIGMCIKYLDKIFECKDGILRKALEEAIIISYVRPFSGYNKKFHEVTDLKKEFKNLFDDNEMTIHERVCSLRNSLIAHSDSKSYGVSFSVGGNEDEKIVIPVQWKSILLLSDRDCEILKYCCLKIETYLFCEQNRIRNLLPIGHY